MLVWEIVLRVSGFSANTTPSVWAIVRARAAQDAPVLVGSSRMMVGLDLDVWDREVGGPRPAQLALSGGGALPFLEDLAADEGVDGLVLVDVVPFHTFDMSGNSSRQFPTRLDEYRRFTKSPAFRVETYLRAGVSTIMTWRTPSADPRNVVGRIWEREGVLEPPESTSRLDRWRPIDFSVRAGRVAWTPEQGFGTREGARRFVRGFGSPANAEETAEIIARIENAAERIRARGGEVVFILFPACGPRKAEEDALYPHAEYWDRLVAATRSRTINSDDYPQLKEFDCYDGSHLDQRDAAPFTRSLIRVLFEGAGPGAS